MSTKVMEQHEKMLKTLRKLTQISVNEGLLFRGYVLYIFENVSHLRVALSDFRECFFESYSICSYLNFMFFYTPSKFFDFKLIFNFSPNAAVKFLLKIILKKRLILLLENYPLAKMESKKVVE